MSQSILEEVPNAGFSPSTSFHEEFDGCSAFNSCPLSALPASHVKWNDTHAPWRTSAFCKCLSSAAMSEFEALGAVCSRDAAAVLLTEGDQPNRVLFLLDGRAKISMNSSEGKRLTLGNARAGDFLGLAAIVSGCPYEVTAEAQSRCSFSSLTREIFLDFLLHCPAAWRTVARQLSVEHRRACEQLRILGLGVNASTKLARLLVDWCADGRQTEDGIQIRCPLTHGEIGEYVGVSRETVTRTLQEFRERRLVEQRGSTLLVLNIRALEAYPATVC